MSLLTDIYNKLFNSGYNTVPSSNGVSYIPQSAITVTARPQTSVYKPTSSYVGNSPAVLGNKAPIYTPTPRTSSVPNQTTPQNTNTTEAQAFGQQQPQNSIPEVDYNALFQPGFDALNEQENYLNTVEKPQVESEIEKNRLKLQGELNDYQTEATQLTDNDKLALENSRDSALSGAIKSYNALRQQKNARFGLSSAGDAVSELAQQSFYQNQGNVEASYSQQLGQIMQKSQNLYSYLAKKKSEIDTSAEDMLTKARNELTKRLMDISAQKGILEQSKTQAKMSALQDAINYSKQVNLMKIQASIQLESFQKENEIAMQNQWTALNQNQVDTSTNVFSGDISNDSINGDTTSARPIDPRTRYLGYTPKYDELEQFTNPFA